MMKNSFYFILKDTFFLKIFKFLSRLFGNKGKTTKFNFKIDDVTTWLRNNYNNTYFPISHDISSDTDISSVSRL